MGVFKDLATNSGFHDLDLIAKSKYNSGTADYDIATEKLTWSQLKTELNSSLTFSTPNATHTGDVTGSGILSISPTAITDQTTVTGISGDFVLISDTSDSGNLKKVDVVDFLGGADTNFGNTALTFTAARTHTGGGYTQTINDGGLKLIFSGGQTNELLGYQSSITNTGTSGASSYRIHGGAVVGETSDAYSLKLLYGDTASGYFGGFSVERVLNTDGHVVWVQNDSDSAQYFKIGMSDNLSANASLTNSNVGFTVKKVATGDIRVGIGAGLINPTARLHVSGGTY